MSPSDVFLMADLVGDEERAAILAAREASPAIPAEASPDPYALAVRCPDRGCQTGCQYAICRRFWREVSLEDCERCVAGDGKASATGKAADSPRNPPDIDAIHGHSSEGTAESGSSRLLRH
jgi:hypothetical protein